jgi:HemY protein
MRKLFALILVALLLGIGVVALIETDPGYLLLTYGNYTLESSLWVGLVLLMLATMVLYFAIALIRKLLGGQQSLASWLGSRRSRAAGRLTNRGLVSFSEGHWAKGRRQLLRGARNNDAGLANYLLAARASQQLGEPEKTREYLAAAADAEPAAGVTVAIARARLRLEAGEYEQALGALKDISKLGARYPVVPDLLRQAYVGLGDWAGLAELLPVLKKSSALPADELLQLERDVHVHLLQKVATSVDAAAAEKLRASWQKMPAELKHDQAMITLYVSLLVRLESFGEAEKVILRELKQRWDPQLACLYGYVKSDNIPRQLARAESWLSAHPQDAQLLLCLGRLCARNKLWGKARDYFESSYRVERSAETCAELGRLLNGLGEARAAAAYYREGLMLHEKQLPELPMPDKMLPQKLLARS